MPFIIQGKTNWKFLLIVIVLAVFVGGIIWTYQQKVCLDCVGGPPINLPPKTEKSASLTTDKTEYKENEIVNVTIKNNSNDLLYYLVDSCYCFPGQFGIEKYDNGKWTKVAANELNSGIQCHIGACIGCLEIESGAETTLKLFNFEKTGKYRLKLDFGKECWASGITKKPDFSVYSNEFLITDETANWKTYRNEEYGFEIKYPETNGISFFKIIVDAEREFLFGTIVCMEGEEATVLGKIRLSPYIEVAASSFEELGRKPTEEECDTLATRYVISGRFCTNKNLTKYQAYCEEGSETSDYHRYDVFLACDGESFKGKEGRIRCNQIFNQMLSTFRFTPL